MKGRNSSSPKVNKYKQQSKKNARPLMIPHIKQNNQNLKYTVHIEDKGKLMCRFWIAAANRNSSNNMVIETAEDQRKNILGRRNTKILKQRKQLATPTAIRGTNLQVKSN